MFEPIMREFRRASPNLKPSRPAPRGPQPGLPERIIAACSRENPADRALRKLLKAERDILPSDARAVSQTVFNYFRWHGWLDLDAPLNLQIRKARELANHFAADPESFSDSSLVERVAPDLVARRNGDYSGLGAGDPVRTHTLAARQTGPGQGAL